MATLFFENTDGRRFGIHTDFKEYSTNFTDEARQCMPNDGNYARISNIDDVLDQIKAQGYTYADEWIREYVIGGRKDV